MRESESNLGKINIKKFRCTSPDGIEYVTERGLCDFCRQHDLQHSNMVMGRGPITKSENVKGCNDDS